MKKSESIAELAKALCKAQENMGAAVKGSENPFYKKPYADLASVIKAIKNPFADNGLCFSQFPVNKDQSIGVITLLMHNSGQFIEFEYFLPTMKQDPQGYGSAITYARRYALMSMAGIPTADDDAESSVMRGERDELLPQYVTAEQTKIILDLIANTGTDQIKFCAAFTCESVSALPSSRFETAVKRLEAKRT